ncbi:WRKY DNA-binding protein 10 [Arabidopsis thaliana]|uniref:Probable WRKY transcription factor 10 n=2 Tax=Arabidopsis thaliana TaxID=3702 RepID=WRK10_ARATH|nr:WRKY DNA-binding protein 10 [Arabidopsis thaliana]Q9LG05.2 RecName: Full=Probable WRKY transcription factor 10; AltName: Full=Protein MINISEED 3; AltName: Full=WRKY DNA-binding protein 10 [Arabidopsis thaliana]AAL61861.1 WRKY transcription factor 10 [Arabidopsis thaliana]ABE65713.1 WRKY family transcription factor [Arabidopsis thaliana]AEE33270.1 WRKY DNA-binding protein 10 [Arabidopsis thaliana]|eukprot:NP_175956.1 WRKY DNA-binding protein 10 [Arabidopsis thaliana]
MSDFDENFIEMTSYWAPPSSPSPRTILAMLEQTDNGLNPISEIFPQESLPRDHTDQSGQRSGLRERLAARVGFNLPTLNTEENMSPLDAFFRSSNVPNSPVVAISPGFSPSALLHTPNMVSDSSQIIPPSSATNYGPLEMVETSGEDNAAMMMFNNDLPYQPYNVDLPSLEVFDDIATEESFYIPSYEPHVDPIGTPLVTSFESELVDDAHTDIISIEDSESEDGNKDDDDEDFQYEDEDEDQYDQDQDVDEDEEEEKDEDNVALDDPQPPPPKRRRYEVSNMIGATRTSKTQRIILQMESDEDNPNDGYRWRKYGQKVVKGNPNPRSYFKCTNIECRVKKHVERGADNIKLVVTTYDGIHNHPSPPARRSNSSSRNRSAGATIPQNQNDRTSRLGRAPPTPTPPTPPPSSYTPEEMRPFSSLATEIDLTEVYMTGISMLPNIPVYENSGFMYQNDEPTMNAMPDGSDVYDGIMERLYFKFGVDM